MEVMISIEKRNKLKRFKVKILRHKKNLGKCRAMLTGISNTTNNLICIMDGDGQNPPYEVKAITFGAICQKDKITR